MSYCLQVNLGLRDLGLDDLMPPSPESGLDTYYRFNLCAYGETRVDDPCFITQDVDTNMLMPKAISLDALVTNRGNYKRKYFSSGFGYSNAALEELWIEATLAAYDVTETFFIRVFKEGDYAAA